MKQLNPTLQKLKDQGEVTAILKNTTEKIAPHKKASGLSLT